MELYSSLSVEELVRCCSSSSDLGAWEEFVRRMHRLIAKVVHRVAERMGDASSQTVDDLIQETYLKLCTNNFRALRDFEHRHEGSFIGFIQVMAANIARDHFRSAYVKNTARKSFDDTPEEAAVPAPANSAGGTAALEREVLVGEIGRHLECCTSGPDQERNRTIFWLHYRTGLSASEIAALPGIGLNTKGVESLILRLQRELRISIAGGKAPAQSTARTAGEGILPAGSF